MVAKYRIDQIAALARQMPFTPADARRQQLAAAEALLHAIDSAKAYPPEFIIFRITGFRPKRSSETALLTGLALQHDLGLLIEQVSETLAMQTASLAEPVLMIEDVCERFNVTSKTIQRWRRRGLAARRMIFPDGRSRVAFLLSSVEQFLATHAQQAGPSVNLAQLESREREEILRRARRLIEAGCDATLMTRRIGRRLKRSPLAVFHTIRKHDQENPAAAILPLAPTSIDEALRAKIVRRCRKGHSIRSIARRLRRPRSSVYLLLLEDRVARLNRRRVKFIDDALYHDADAEQAIAAIARQDDLLAAEPSAEERRVPRDLPAYLQALYRTPLLTPPRERALFIQFNYHKYRFAQARRRLDPQLARARDLNLLEGHLRRAANVKNEIVRANLRLVVSIARKHLRPALSLMELISDGNLTLMRAVESFDVHRGNRFSTYATFALMKGFARSVPMMRAEQIGVGPRGVRGGIRREALAGDFADASVVPVAKRLILRDDVRAMLATLDPRERELLTAHFGLASESRSRDEIPASLEELSARFDLSIQRLRQIERAALKKLRATAEMS